MASMSYDVMASWQRGEVPHVQPVKPTPRSVLPSVRAGPNRLKKVLEMWIDTMPPERKDALSLFLKLV